MQFPLLKTVEIEIELPVYETQTLVISYKIRCLLQAVARNRSVEDFEIVVHYDFSATPSVSQGIFRQYEINGDYVIKYRQEVTVMLQEMKLINPSIRSVDGRIQGEMEQDPDTLCTLVDFQWPKNNSTETRAVNPASPDASNPVAGVSIDYNDIAFHLCPEAVDSLSDALWDCVDDRQDVAARFPDYRAQTPEVPDTQAQTAEESAPSSESESGSDAA